MSGAAPYRLGVDVGGTHTDLVLLDADSGRILVEKVPSTPANPAAAVLDGLARFVDRGVAPEDIGFFAHGTTITTNALLEMRGARVGMLIARGYRAIQEVQTQARDGNPFDYFFRRPDPIAPQSLTREIPGRIDYEGNELAPLDEAAVREAARSLRDAGVELLTATRVVEAHGEERVESVTVETNGERRVIEADCLCMAGPRSPDVRLASRLGVPRLDVPVMGGYTPAHDKRFATPIAGVFVCGDGAGVENGAVSLESGRLAGLAVATYLGKSHLDAEQLTKLARGRLAYLRRGSRGRARRKAKAALARAASPPS